MLNELYDLSLSLERAGITPTDWHRDLKELPKVAKGSPCFKVYIAENGEIAEIESIEDSTKIEGLRKWQSGGNGYSFPCFNVKPLFKAYAGDIADTAERKEYDDWIKELKRTPASNATSLLNNRVESALSLWGNDDSKRISACLGSIPTELNKILGAAPTENSSITSLIERCCKTSPEKFLRQLVTALKARIVKKRV